MWVPGLEGDCLDSHICQYWLDLPIVGTSATAHVACMCALTHTDVCDDITHTHNTVRCSDNTSTPSSHPLTQWWLYWLSTHSQANHIWAVLYRTGLVLYLPYSLYAHTSHTHHPHLVNRVRSHVNNITPQVMHLVITL